MPDYRALGPDPEPLDTERFNELARCKPAKAAPRRRIRPHRETAGRRPRRHTEAVGGMRRGG